MSFIAGALFGIFVGLVGLVAMVTPFLIMMWVENRFSRRSARWRRAPLASLIVSWFVFAYLYTELLDHLGFYL